MYAVYNGKAFTTNGYTLSARTAGEAKYTVRNSFSDYWITKKTGNYCSVPLSLKMNVYIEGGYGNKLLL